MLGYEDIIEIAQEAFAEVIALRVFAVLSALLVRSEVQEPSALPAQLGETPDSQIPVRIVKPLV